MIISEDGNEVPLRSAPRVAALLLLLVLLGLIGVPAHAQRAVVDPSAQPKFVNPLANPLDPRFIFTRDSTTADGQAFYQIGVFQFQKSLGLLDSQGNPISTTVWGYGKDKAGATYPGRTFVARRNEPINVRWTNNLVDDSGVPLPHLLPIDTSIMWAMPMDPPYPDSGVPVVAHLHGGHVESLSDGLSEAWFTPGFAQTGIDRVKEVYHFDISQQAATLWYHDHTLGITRLNVYAGLAGFFIVRDEVDTGLRGNPLGLPVFPYEVPIMIQDRMFTADGQLFYPSAPEFFGNFILVNGETWPVMDVEPRKYRLRLLNGSDARFYNIWITPAMTTALSTGPTLYQIGTDQGLLYAPVPLDHLTLAPGERADTIVDFSAFAGQTLIVRNDAPAPYPKGEAADPLTVGQIMAFRVGTSVTERDDPLPATLRPGPIEPLRKTGPTRELLLFETKDESGRSMPMLGTADRGALHYNDRLTENPRLNDVEVWEIYNATDDVHPIHLHMVAFQLLNRQQYEAHVAENGALSGIRLIGQPRKPAANEAGWKDTIQTLPGTVTRIIARFDRPGKYVWHCHILSHEDHDMMRPYCVGDLANCLSPAPRSPGPVQ